MTNYVVQQMYRSIYYKKYEIPPLKITLDLESIKGLFTPSQLKDPKVKEKPTEIQHQLDKLEKSSKKPSSQPINSIIKSESSSKMEWFQEYGVVEKYKLKSENYTIGKLFIQTSSYKIFKGQNKLTNKPVNIMKLRKSENREKVFNRLIRVQTTVKHQYLESFERSFESPPPLWLAAAERSWTMYLMQRRAIKDAYKNQVKKKKDTDSESGEKVPFIIEQSQKKIIAYKIATAMAYLHSLNIIHRDLCTSNITIDKDFNPRMIKI